MSDALAAVGRRPAFWLIALVAGVGTAIVVGLPTVLIPSPFFLRMTPVRPLDYVLWLATALLTGPLVAMYVPRATGIPVVCSAGPARLTIGGVLWTLGGGCPVCNKVAVLLLGAGGALPYFPPLQPLLGALAIALLAATLPTRLRVMGLQVAPAGPPVPPTRR